MPSNRTSIDLLKRNFHRNLKHIKPIMPVNKSQQEQVFEPSKATMDSDIPFYELQLHGTTMDVAYMQAEFNIQLAANPYALYKIFRVQSGVKTLMPYKPRKRIPNLQHIKIDLLSMK